AGRGIGAAIARTLATEGAAVALCDLDGDTARDTAAQITASGGRALGVQMDVTRSGQVNEVVARVAAELGPVDTLVNNAGWDKVEPFIKSTEETWDRVLAVNLKGQLICARA